MLLDSHNGGGSPWEVAIIEDRAGFQALEAGWRELDGQSGVRLFQQFEWASAWLDAISAAGARLRVGALRQAGRLVAVLPLCVRRYKGVRMLEWIGGRVTDYCDGLVDASLDPDRALGALWEAIASRGGFDVARLSHVRVDAKIFGTLDALNPWTETFENAGGVAIVWPTGAQWIENLSAERRDRVKYNARRMTKSGFEIRVCTDADTCGPLIDFLIEHKRRWLAARDLTSYINEPAGVEFLHTVVRAAAARGELHLSTVRSKEGQLVACDLAFVREGTVYCYMASFDQEFAKYSFGRVLTDQLIMWACDSGYQRLDLLLGAHGYKDEYGCDQEPVRTLVVPRGVLGRMAVSFYRRKVDLARAQVPV